MTAIFRKAQHMSLANESEDADEDMEVVIDSDKSTLLASEDEESKADSNNIGSGGEVRYLQSPRTTNWRFWNKRRRYELASTEDKSDKGKKITLCGHTCYLCRVNSWRAVFLALAAFSIAMVISVIVSKLAVEPPEPKLSLLKGGVASDAAICANLSAEILVKNGSAVDAGVTAALCNGVVHPESSGIGGGGFMIVRLGNGSVYSIDFRAVAPNASNQTMFHSDPKLSSKGGLSIALPGELKGLETAHKLFGRLTWKELVDPVIQLCREGHHLTNHTVRALDAEWKDLSDNIRRIYTSENGTRKKFGDLVKRPDLARTLEYIAINGADAIYGNSSISRNIVQTIEAYNGILTLKDLMDYEVKVQEPVQAEFGDYTLFSHPLPSGGPELLYMLSLMNEYHLNSSANLNLTYHRLMEAFKFAFAERTKLGDPFCNSVECENVSKEILQANEMVFNLSYVAEIWSSISDDQTYNVSHYHPDFANGVDSGTSHISIVAPDGSAVGITTSVNTYFGSNIMTDTGIVLNDDMDDFSSPNITNDYGLRPSVANFIFPGKRPLSSMCPTIAVKQRAGGMADDDDDDGGSGVVPLIVIGASGGSLIPTAVVQAFLQVAVFGESISTAIEFKRLHDQLVPNAVFHESGFPEEILDYLEDKGHEVIQRNTSAIVQGIVVGDDGELTGHADSRKNGAFVLVNRTTTTPL